MPDIRSIGAAIVAKTCTVHAKAGEISLVLENLSSDNVGNPWNPQNPPHDIPPKYIWYP